MNQKRNIDILRFLERFGLLLFLGGLFFLASQYTVISELTTKILYSTGTISVIGLGLFLYSGMRINHKIDLLTSQSNFAMDSQFMALFERSPVPYIIIDQKGVVTKINQMGVKLLRSQVEKLTNTNLLDRFVDCEESDISTIVNKVKSGVTINDIGIAVEPDIGERLWVLLSSYSNPDNEQIFVSLVDVTQAKKVDTAKSEFLALATHQLGTPIAAIRWNTELLIKHTPQEMTGAIGGYTEKIQKNTIRMSALIDDFLNVSKLELGTFATEPTEVKIKSFIDGIVDEFSQGFAEKNISLERNEQPPDFSLQIDERLFHIVVSNLVSNATKYVNESGTIWLSTNIEDGKFFFTITDDGIGVPKTEVEQLFTKFYRASNAMKHKAEGTGLGLYAVKQALDLLGGTVTLDTDTERGAKFVVMIPTG